MYLVNTASKTKLFSLLESCLDFVLDDDCYVYEHPEISRLNGNNEFDKFLTFRDRLDFEGNEVEYEDRPKDTDHFTFELHPSDLSEQLHTGWLWVDRFNEFKRFKQTVLDFAIEMEQINKLVDSCLYDSSSDGASAAYR